MNCLITFRPSAKQDFSEAFAWYEQQTKGLGNRFEAAVDQTLKIIREFPDAFPTVHRDVRRALVRRFPYSIFYRMREETIHVIAIMHGRRNPAAWRSRQ